MQAVPPKRNFAPGVTLGRVRNPPPAVPLAVSQISGRLESQHCWGGDIMCFTDDRELGELIDTAVENQKRALELLRARPDLIARRNRLGETALHFLAVENYPKGVDFLCRHGADVNSMDLSRATPLLHASMLEYPEVVRILLEHGANPNTEDDTGETPLSCAKDSGNGRIIEMLISAGAGSKPDFPPNGAPPHR